MPPTADPPDEPAAGEGWDPPPGTDALFPPDDFGEDGAGSAPGGDAKRPRGQTNPVSTTGVTGSNPFPGPGDEPYPAELPAGPTAMAEAVPTEPLADAVGAGTASSDDLPARPAGRGGRAR